MHVEVSIAVNYILSHLYTKLPRRRVDSFGEELEKYLHAKFQHHWFPNDPARDSAFRCINSVGPQVDLLLPEAAAVSGLDWSEIQACLPEGLVLSIDPGHVTCQYQQPSYGQPELNRFHSTPFWSPTSISLSSSGCSSASSSISSTNLTPTSGQVTHQVLYSLQDNWFTSNGNHWSDGITTNNSVSKQLKQETEHGDHLATAAALSVLVDSEDNVGTNIGQEPTTVAGMEGMKSQNIWIHDPTHLDTYESATGFQMRGASFKTMDSTKVELSNGLEVKSSACTTPWGIPETETESTLLSLLHAELSGISDSPSQTTVLCDKLQITHRSASNPAQTDQANFTNLQELIPFSTTTSCIGPANQALQPKLEHTVMPPYNQVPHGFTSVFPQTFTTTAVSPFVQKSTSTPSFTAATFAQTKFGSTKLKSHSKRTPSRILSPTTVQPKFASMNCNGGLTRESVVSAVLGGNHRLVQGTNADLSAFRQFMPLPMDMNTTQIKQSNTNDPLFPSDCTNLKTLDNGPLNIVTTTAFDTNSSINFGIQVQNGNSLPQAGNLDEFFSGPLEESSGETVTDKPSLLENGQHPSLSSAAAWPISTMRLYRELNAVHSDSFHSGTDWIQPTFPTSADCEKTPFNLSGRSLKADDHLGLQDDALLSARMVNLLLDEDSSHLGTGQEQPKQNNLFGKNFCFDTQTQPLKNGDQQSTKKVLDNIKPFTSNLDQALKYVSLAYYLTNLILCRDTRPRPCFEMRLLNRPTVQPNNTPADHHSDQPTLL
ncbi:protein Tob/BTG [Clonorchis sinensis]|uniref:Protein Tob/BTG n=1 Tax=Clonorchis sinensis TaxID=79923 RepID=G7YLS8_CLOSI|nr:protein Tob/BTG [Clonorchis sinensis]